MRLPAMAAFMHPVMPKTCDSGAAPKRTSVSVNPSASATAPALRAQRRPAQLDPLRLTRRSRREENDGRVGCAARTRTERSRTSDSESNGLSGTTTPPFRSVPWKRGDRRWRVRHDERRSSPAKPARSASASSSAYVVRCPSKASAGRSGKRAAGRRSADVTARGGRSRAPAGSTCRRGTAAAPARVRARGRGTATARASRTDSPRPCPSSSSARA